MAWPAQPLEAVAEIGSGITKGRKLKGRATVSVPYLRVANVQAGYVDVSDVTEIEVPVDEVEKFRLQAGDVVMTEGGDPDKLGRGAVWDGSVDPCVHQDHIFKVRPDPTRLDSRYLDEYLGSVAARKYFLRCAKQTTGIATINKTQLRAFPVPLPSLTEQRRIADILDKADIIRGKRQEAIALTESLLRSAYLKLVGTKHPAYKKWPIRRLEDLAADSKSSMRTGPFGSALKHSEFVSEGIAVLGIDNAVQNRFVWAERRYITEEKYAGLKRYTVFPGDVIVTIMGTTGRSAVAPDEISTSISTKHLATITINRELAHPEFVSNAIHRDPFVLSQIHSRSRGAIMSGLNLGLIRELEVHLPPLADQQRFADALAQIRKLQDTYQSASGGDDDLFNSLVQRAFRGQLSA